MSGFVDLHSHVLHGLDDGARSLDQSVAMLTLARDGGTTDIVATPHANGRYRFRPDAIEERLAELNGRVPGITVHRGCDFHLQVKNIDDALDDPQKYTINGRGYLMVEFPDTTIFPTSQEILGELLDAGMRPVITHPERNDYLQRHPEVLARWIEDGCAVQVTAASCVGLFGARPKAVALELIARNCVHVIASDAHDHQMRTPDMRPAYQALVKAFGEDRIRPLFVDNPRAALVGDDMPHVSSPTFGPARRWWQFWR